jgi:dolichol kinase
VTDAGAPLTVRRELARKALHLSWALVPIAYAMGAPRRLVIGTLLGACACAIIVELARSRSERVRLVFDRATGLLLRAHEHHRWSGATWLLLSFLLAVLLFEAPIAIAAMWAVAAGDASAAIVGRAIGRYRIGRSRKSVEGSIACAITSAAGASLLAQLSPASSIVAGISAAAAEWPARPLDDNMRIGMAVGIGILLSRMVFS